MKGTVYLSLALDILGVAVILLPAKFLAGFSTDPKVVRYLKIGVAVALLLSGFLVDMFITHGG